MKENKWKKFGELSQPVSELSPHISLGAAALSMYRVLELNHDSPKEGSPSIFAVQGSHLGPHRLGKRSLVPHSKCMFSVSVYEVFFTVTDRNDQLNSSSLADRAQSEMAALEKDQEMLLSDALIWPGLNSR